MQKGHISKASNRGPIFQNPSSDCHPQNKSVQPKPSQVLHCLLCPKCSVLVRITAQDGFSPVLPATTLRGLEGNETQRIHDLLAILDVVPFPFFFSYCLFFFFALLQILQFSITNSSTNKNPKHSYIGSYGEELCI